MTITTMADHSQRQQKSPPSTTHKALHPAPSSSIDGRRPPEQADIFFKGLRGCMALSTLRCYDDASSPEQSKERIEGHTPPQHPLNYIRLRWGSLPINLTRQHKAQCLVCGVRGTFPPSAAMVVTVFCSVPEHKPLFPVEPWHSHSGYHQKALISSNMILVLYRGGGVEIKEKRR